jgi:hypothetical protein
MSKPKIDRTVTRLDTYTLYLLRCIAMENNISYRGMDKEMLFNHLDSLDLLDW